MQKTLLFLLFLTSHLIFGQEFDKKLWEKIIQAEKIIHSQDFKKAEQFFNTEILFLPKNLPYKVSTSPQKSIYIAST